MAPTEPIPSQDRSKPTLAEVYDAHLGDVYGFIAYRVYSREQAEDLTQLTFERALRAWPRFDPDRASAKTWLIAIARNLIIDHSRALKPTVSLEQSERGQSVDPVPIEERANLGLSSDLAAALGRLTQRDREVIALRFGGDMKGAEIAELLGLTLANVQQIISRSLRKMESFLEGERDAGSDPPPQDLKSRRTWRRRLSPRATKPVDADTVERASAE